MTIITRYEGVADGADIKEEDIANVSGDKGSFILGVRNDVAAVRTSADGDYSPIATDSAGRIGIADLGGAISIDDNAGSLTIDNAALSVTGGGLESTSLRVTIASDSTGLISVDDNAGSLTVDGTVTANAGTGTFTVGGTVTANAGTGTFTVDSELPAAAVLADATANPTTPLAGSATEIFNGTTWDRARGDITNGLDVDVTRLPSLPAGANSIGTVTANAGTGTFLVDSELPAAAALSDAIVNPTSPIVGAASLQFNNTNWERVRGITTGTLLASAARTASTNSLDVTNFNNRGIFIFIDVTAIVATPSVTVEVQMKDPVTSDYKSITPAMTAFTAVGESVYYVGPDATTNAALRGFQNLGALPRTFRVRFAHIDADSITYSAGFSLAV